MDVSTLGLLSALLLVTVSGTQKCVPQALPDMVIDINEAVARGARFTDPLSVGSVAECLAACCMDRGGDRDCNLLVFDARKGRGRQNCYVFHCPTLDSCPLLPSPGVLSYSFWSETSHPVKSEPVKGQKPKSSDGSKVQGPRKESGAADKEPGPLDQGSKQADAVVASQGSAKNYTKEGAAGASKSITTQLLHLADKIEQHLEKMESDPQVHHPSPTAAITPTIRMATIPVHREVKTVPAKAPKAGRVEDAKSAGTAPNRTSPRLRTAAPQPVPTTKADLIEPPAASQDVRDAKKVPSSDVKSAKVPGSDHTTNNSSAKEMPKKVVHPPIHTEVPTLRTVHHTSPPQMATHSTPLQTLPRKGTNLSAKTNDHPSTGDEGETPGGVLPETRPPLEPPVNLKEASRTAGSAGAKSAFPLLEDKSGLVAALVFGMLFLMVVIGLVSRKVSEARRRHRYTKLDYLINGMYVDT
ncbi:MANSC domain-containing protein 1 [Rhinoderma darwinii]|uniref:MANSC domain-containing protein 1 n=1 Tax=Rhinoderma darwinii TaxID=43563 RepID=UPI003F66E4AD